MILSWKRVKRMISRSQKKVKRFSFGKYVIKSIDFKNNNN